MVQGTDRNNGDQIVAEKDVHITREQQRQLKKRQQRDATIHDQLIQTNQDEKTRIILQKIQKSHATIHL
jgi:hypothetical protein